MDTRPHTDARVFYMSNLHTVRLLTTYSINICLLVIVFLSPIPIYAAPCEYDEGSSTHEEIETSMNYSDTIYLSEIYPAPTSDEEEFIELYNAGTESVDLSEWILADASGKKYVIDSTDFMTTVIDDGGYFVISQSISSLYLNNSGDSVYLYQPNEQEQDYVEYAQSETGWSWSSIEDEWQWSSVITEGSENQLSPSEVSALEIEESEENEGTDTSSDEETIDESKLQSSDSMYISELLPNPEGLDSTDEWIEVFNSGDEAIYLGGWKLTDESTYYSIEDVTIEAGEYMVFEVGETGISLNNSGDTIYLIDPYSVIIHGTTYTSATESESWNYTEDGQWAWSSVLTPGEENTVSIIEEKVDSTDDANESAAPEEDDIDIVSIDVFRSLEDNTTATIQGVVTVLPDVFGSQYFYIQDEYSGIQVYSHKKTFPDLTIGDRIQITGTKSQSRGETRIKITRAEQISIIGTGEIILARDVSSLEESLEGMLVQVSGEIVESSSSAALIDDSIQVALKKSTGISSSLLEEGSQTTIIGIVSQQTDSYRLLPRSEEDITTEESEELAWIDPAEASSGSTAATQLANDTSPGSMSETVVMIVVIIGLVLIIGGYKWKEWQRNYAKTSSGAEDGESNKKSVETSTTPPASLLELVQKQIASQKK